VLFFYCFLVQLENPPPKEGAVMHSNDSIQLSFDFDETDLTTSIDDLFSENDLIDSERVGKVGFYFFKGITMYPVHWR